jgi:hypothetical protein
MLSQLCNKCGLFERTHNRARPEQFPHKRGPLATSSLKVRTSPPQHNAVPPVSALPPHQYNHPSIAPLLSRTESAHTPSRGEPLPQIQSWLPSATTPAGKRPPKRYSRMSTDLLTFPQHTYRIVLAARSSNGICSSRVIRFPLHLTSKSTSSLSLPVFCSRRPWYIGIGLYSLPRSLDGVRAVPHPPFSYHSIDHLRHAALPSLSLPLATVLTDSVIYICCERTGCSVDLLYRFFFVRFGRNLRSLYRNEILSSH